MFNIVKKVQRKSKPIKDNKVMRKTKTATDNILNLQRNIGNQGVKRLFDSKMIQGKLSIGRSDDIYEQEADRVADEVMQMREERVQREPISKSITPFMQTKSDTQTPQVTPNIESKINALQGSGQPLSPQIRSFFEPRFGEDFSGVRVHTDSNANQLARSLNASAFTRGHDIVFGGGEYSPESSSGKKLLGHELTHVVQQNGRKINRSVIQASRALFISTIGEQVYLRNAVKFHQQRNFPPPILIDSMEQILQQLSQMSAPITSVRNNGDRLL